MLDSIKTMEHCDEDTVLVLADEVDVETSTSTSSTMVRSMMFNICLYSKYGSCLNLCNRLIDIFISGVKVNVHKN